MSRAERKEKMKNWADKVSNNLFVLVKEALEAGQPVQAIEILFEKRLLDLEQEEPELRFTTKETGKRVKECFAFG